MLPAISRLGASKFHSPGWKMAHEWLFAAVLVITVLAVVVPFSPELPRAGLDPSWSFAMNQAVAQGLVIGQDVIFTFGPYASIYTKEFHPATDHLMLWGGLYFGCSFSLAAYLNFRKQSCILQFGLVFCLSALIHSRDALLFLYPLMAGVAVHKISDPRDDDRGGDPVILLAILFAPLGLLPLIKVSTMFASLAVIVLSAISLGMSRRWALSGTVVAAPVVAAMFFWTIAQQPPGALLQYVLSSQSIISGYSDAMSLRGAFVDICTYMIGASALLVWSYQSSSCDHTSRILVLLQFACILLLAFKSGFTRQDAHILIAADTLLLAALLASTINSMTAAPAPALFPVALVASIFLTASVIPINLISVVHYIGNTYQGSFSGLWKRIDAPDALRNSFDQRLAELRTAMPFPALNGTVDVYSYDQSYLFASGNTWNPRPVFQSYSVYTPQLADLNHAHLLGPGRPDNIIFNVQPIDGRLPSLEDGASWPTILSAYEPTSIDQGYLVLRHRTDAASLAREQKIILRAVHELDQPFTLPESDELVFATIRMRQTLWGHLLTILYKPSELTIRVVMKQGEERRYRMIAGMAASKFLLSPLVETAKEFGQLYTGTDALAYKKVKSITLSEEGQFGMWEHQFEVELVSMH